jgi:hypothetical protein
MNRLDHVRKLTETGELNWLFSNGMVSGKVLMYRDMFFDYDIQIRQGAKKMTALQTTADRYSVSVQTIYRAIKWMQG